MDILFPVANFDALLLLPGRDHGNGSIIYSSICILQLYTALLHVCDCCSYTDICHPSSDNTVIGSVFAPSRNVVSRIYPRSYSAKDVSGNFLVNETNTAAKHPMMVIIQHKWVFCQPSLYLLLLVYAEKVDPGHRLRDLHPLFCSL